MSQKNAKVFKRNFEKSKTALPGSLKFKKCFLFQLPGAYQRTIDRNERNGNSAGGTLPTRPTSSAYVSKF